MTRATARRTSTTQIDIDLLAGHIAADGTVAHHEALGLVADAAEAAAMLPGSVAVLRDLEAGDAIRARAFLAVARRWDEILAAQRREFDRAFEALASHWEAHQQLRSQGTIERLARSSARLAVLRSAMRNRVPASR